MSWKTDLGSDPGPEDAARKRAERVIVGLGLRFRTKRTLWARAIPCVLVAVDRASRGNAHFRPGLQVVA